MRGKADRSGWNDIHIQVPLRRSPQTTATRSRGWYHARWIALILILIVAKGYAVSTYFAAKAGQTSSLVEWFAPPHSVAALRRQEQPGLSAVAQEDTSRARTPPHGYRPDQTREQTASAPALATRRIEPDAATRAKLEQMGVASKAGALKCIAGIPYEITKKDGVTSYTNFPGATCNTR